MLKPLLTIAVLSACSSSIAAPSTSPVAKADDDAVIELAARRAQLLGWLHEYGDAGVYPTDASGKPASVFVDQNGVRCPMAELIFKSGREDLVAAVAKNNNGVRLVDVHEGPLHDWMLSSGLTLAEINLIQGAMNISYRWMENQVIPIETGPAILAAKAQVRGKLETAEMAIRDSTATSLGIAAKRIPMNRTVDALAHSPIETGAVVPKAVAQKVPAQRPIYVGTMGRRIQIN